MAYIVKFGVNTFINISHSVGMGGANKPDDVYIVQAFLSLIQRTGKGTELDKAGFTPYLATASGRFDHKTQEAIRNFQFENQIKGKRTRPASGFVRRGEDNPKVSGASYESTIYQLNDSLQATALITNIFPKSLQGSTDCVAIMSEVYGRDLRGILARGTNILIETDI